MSMETNPGRRRFISTAVAGAVAASTVPQAQAWVWLLGRLLLRPLVGAATRNLGRRALLGGASRAAVRSGARIAGRAGGRRAMAGAAGATSVTTTNVIAEEVAIELLLQAWEGGATDAARPSAHQLQPAVQEVHVQPWRADQEQDLDISTRNVTDRMVSATLVVGIEDLLTHEIYMVHERPLTLLPGADWTFPLEFGVLELHGPHRFIAALPELPKARIAPSAPVYFYQG